MSEPLDRHFEPWIYRLTRGVAAFIYEYLYDLEISGQQHIPREGGFLLASNHASFFDPPLAGYPVPRPIYYFARRTLMEKGFSKWLLGSLSTIPVDRDGPQDLTAIKTVMRLVQEGNGLLVFPEGTRTQDGELQSAKAGVGLLAIKTDVPVIPCRLWGTFELYPKGSKFPVWPGKLHLSYGPALMPEDFDPGGKGKERYGIAADRIMESIAKLKKPETVIV